MVELAKYKDTNILFVDDDDAVRGFVQSSLNSFFKNVYTASDGREGIRVFSERQVDLIITDIEMPEVNGLEFIRRIRELDPFQPVIVLSAYTDREYLLNSANLNIQGYVVKPLGMEKIKAVLLRTQKYIKAKRQKGIELGGGYIYDLNNSRINEGARPCCTLNKKEKLLLELLLEHENRVVSYETIEQTVWGDYWEVMTSYALRTVVKNLRKKIGKEKICNISGQGYKLELTQKR